MTARDKYLQKKFNITEEEFKAMSEHGCMGCGGEGVTRSLHVDHDHKIEKWPVVSSKVSGVWYAWPSRVSYADEDSAIIFTETARTKSEALRKVRRKLLRLSVRAVLCFPCNSAVKKLRDDPKIAIRLASCLDNHFKKVFGK